MKIKFDTEIEIRKVHFCIFVLSKKDPKSSFLVQITVRKIDISRSGFTFEIP